MVNQILSFSALTLLLRWQERHPAYKKIEWWGASMVICLERVQMIAYGPADVSVISATVFQFQNYYCYYYCYYYDYIRLTAFFQDKIGKLAPER